MMKKSDGNTCGLSRGGCFSDGENRGDTEKGFESGGGCCSSSERGLVTKVV